MSAAVTEMVAGNTAAYRDLLAFY